MNNSKLDFTPHQQKVIELDNHIALTANAGSGKTFVLKYKYLKAAKELNGDVSKIAAITFTNKAANELYKKISELVDEEISETKDLSQLKVLYRIRRNLVSAYISTIHSFCIELLKNYPIEAGIDANFTPIDQVLSDELIEMSIEEVVEELFRDADKNYIIKDLIRFFGSRYKLQSELKDLVINRKKILSLQEKIYSKSDDEIKNHFDEYFKEIINEINKIYSSDFIASLKKVNDIVLSNDGKNQSALSIQQVIKNYEANNDLIYLLKNISELAFIKSGGLKKQGYFTSKLQEGYYNEVKLLEEIYSKLKLFVDANLDFELHKKLATFGKKILFVFECVVSTYEKKKLENSYIDFDDILIKTKFLLKINEIRKELSEKFKYLMVDEYQDTDETQYEIFLPILDDLKSGKLFIVGDEKQSIYRFRDADLDVFKKTTEDILNQNKETGHQLLPDSFRMVKELCVFTNFVFDRLFKESIPLFNELKNAPIVCAKDFELEGEIEFLVSNEKEDVGISQAELVSSKILEIVQTSNYKFSDISVLVTKRIHFDELEKIFTIKNIPYKIVGGRGFFQRQVVSDIRNYLSFISNVNDDVSLVAILRSPFFMLSDSEIVKISFCKGETIYQKFKDFSASNTKYLHIVSLLERHINLCSSLPISILIRKILSETDYLLIIKNRHNGEQEIANIEKIMSLAREFDSTGFRTFYDFVKYLDDSIENRLDEAQAEGLLSNSGVQLMTIHQAKGLEFPIVFLYRAEAFPESSSNKAREISINKDVGLLFQVRPNDNPTEDFVKPPILLVHDFVENTRDLAEIKRLLYVGFTRAINKLFISFDKNEKDNYNPKSFIKLLKDVINLDNDKITIEDELKFLKKESNGNYSNFTEVVKVNIKQNSEVDVSKTNMKENIEKDPQSYLFLTHRIKEENKNQIISATKISTFEKCPLKYHLTYNIGLARLLKLLPEDKIYKQKLSDFIVDLEKQDINELQIDNLLITEYGSQKLGGIIHKILESNIAIDKIPDYLNKNFINSFGLKKEEINLITSILKNFYSSDVYKEINSYNDYKNEFEIIVKEDDVILKGIIDKIIFNENSVLIIDYKTDFISDSELLNRYADYQMQMKFYLYISMRFFENINNFTSKLIFLRYPNQSYEMSYDRGELPKLKDEIFSLIKGILEKNTNKNLMHCNNCLYFLSNKNCIVK